MLFQFQSYSNCRKSLNRCRTLRLLFSFSGIKQTQTYVEVKLNQFPEVIFPSFEAKKAVYSTLIRTLGLY